MNHELLLRLRQHQTWRAYQCILQCIECLLLRALPHEFLRWWFTRARLLLECATQLRKWCRNLTELIDKLTIISCKTEKSFDLLLFRWCRPIAHSLDFVFDHSDPVSTHIMTKKFHLL